MLTSRAMRNGRPGSGGRVAIARRALSALLPLVLLVPGAWALWVRFNPVGPNQPSFVRTFNLYADYFNYYIPMTNRAAERLAAGELPLWNPDACSGIPFLATLQTAVFYPGTWLALLVPAERVLPALGFAECILGGLFAAWLFRAWGCGWAGASAGGLLFAFACCLATTMWPPAIATVCWIPWLLLCVERLARGPSLGWWIGLVAGCGLQVLAAFPPYLIYGYYLVAPFAVLRLAEQRWRHGVAWGEVGRRAAVLSVAPVLGLGLAAVQLAPTAELVSQSLRAERLTPQEVHYLAPRGFRTSDEVLAGAFDPNPGPVAFGYSHTGYVGTATLVLMAAALVARRREPLLWLLLIVGGIALLLSDGYWGATRGLYAAYAELPVLGSLRSPERQRIVTAFAAVALASLGFAALEGERSRRERRVLSAVCVLAAGGVAFGMVSRAGAAEAWRPALALALCLAILWSGSARLRAAAATLLAVFLAVDVALATPGRAALRQIPSGFVGQYHTWGGRLPPKTLAAARKRVGDGRLELWRYAPHVGAGPTGGVRRISCYEPLVPAQWAALHERLTGESGGGNTLRLEPSRFPALLDVTSVRGVIAPRHKDGALFVENEDALPRAYFIGRYRVASREEALDHIALDDFDFREAVLLERDPGLAPSGAPLVPARIVEDHPERVAVHVNAPGPGLLVLTDTYYAGWQARLDGEPAEILLANGIHRAVTLEEGRHQVVFEYRPRSLRAGAALSLATAAIIAAVAIQGLRRRRAAGKEVEPPGC